MATTDVSTECDHAQYPDLWPTDQIDYQSSIAPFALESGLNLSADDVSFVLPNEYSGDSLLTRDEGTNAVPVQWDSFPGFQDHHADLFTETTLDLTSRNQHRENSGDQTSNSVVVTVPASQQMTKAHREVESIDFPLTTSSAVSTSSPKGISSDGS